MFHQKLFK